MQEEVTQKTIALSMKTGKLTAQALQAALKKYLQHRAHFATSQVVNLREKLFMIDCGEGAQMQLRRSRCV